MTGTSLVHMVGAGLASGEAHLHAAAGPHRRFESVLLPTRSTWKLMVQPRIRQEWVMVLPHLLMATAHPSAWTPGPQGWDRWRFT